MCAQSIPINEAGWEAFSSKSSQGDIVVLAVCGDCEPATALALSV